MSKSKISIDNMYYLLHLLFWIGYAVLFYASSISFLTLQQGVIMVSVNMLSQLTLTIITNNYLIPVFFNKGKYIKYSLFILIGMSFVITIRFMVNERIIFSLNRFPNLKIAMYLLFIIITTVVVFLITTGFYFFKQWFIARQKQNEIANQQLNTELKLLKAQINPHFLFNALNNVYSLTQVEPEKAGEMVLKLSEVLRYMLYDSEKDKIYLEKEISNINSLIELHQIQYDHKAAIDFSISVNTQDKLIHPMLLFPFFENAFKHGNFFQTENAYIKSNLLINDNHLYFSIENTFVENTSKDKVGGLGIDNVQKRLQLFYPDKYQLEIKNAGKVFKVELKIELV